MEHTDDTQMPGANDQPEAHEDAGETLPRPSGIMPYALKQGLILGLSYVLISVIAYALGPGVMLHWSTQIGMWSMLLISLGFIIFMGRRLRKARKEGLSFGEGWIYSYVVFSGGLLLHALWKLLLFTVIDPEIGEAIAEEVLAKYPEIGDESPDTVASIRHQLGAAFKAHGIALEALTGLAWNIVLSMLSGLIIRKNPPENA